jgi:hypothetical protein
MDRADVEQRAEEHGQAIVRGDMDAVMADIAKELHPGVPQVAGLLPQPTTNADVVSVDVQDDHAICDIRYSNDQQSITMRSRWEDRDGRPRIVEVGPVA